MKEVTINPITRLEGHGKITVFLNDEGDVKNAYLQVPELRGFEKFCEGRLAEDMPVITSRVCGVCPVAHHLASAKALDMVYAAEPPVAAKKLRELMYMGYMVYDHILNFYFLAAPDFVVGHHAPPSERNIFGVLKKVGLDIGKEVIKHRAYGQRVVEILGGKATHPVSAVPGGISKGLDPKEKREIESIARSSIEFAQFTLKLFEDIVLRNNDYLKLILSEAFQLRAYNMGLVDSRNRVNLYEGDIRVTDQNGRERDRFKATDYLDHISEHVEPWTYSKFTYLKKVGWKGLADGSDSGMYRVGPLARLNAAQGMATPLADYEFRRMYDVLGGHPANSTLAYHWARLIELLYAAERALELAEDPEIASRDLRRQVGSPGEGVGVVEAARGTLFHHYKVSPDGLVQKVNLIVATTNNYSSICVSIRNAAKSMIRNGKVSQGLLNMVEMAFRAYDPCFACSTHSLPGGNDFAIDIYDSQGRLYRRIG